MGGGQVSGCPCTDACSPCSGPGLLPCPLGVPRKPQLWLLQSRLQAPAQTPVAPETREACLGVPSPGPCCLAGPRGDEEGDRVPSGEQDGN